MNSSAEIRAKAIIGEPAPDFELPSTKKLDTLDVPIRLSAHRGRWVALLFYPLDFTFVCPTELIAFSDRHDELSRLGADVIGISTDSVFSHRAWMKLGRAEGGIGELRFPLASDMTHETARAYGVLLESKGHCLRGTFLVDPEGALRYALVHDNAIGRSVDETLRALQALQTGGLCPIDWKPGEATL